jgi:DNA-binding helix-hairpin-helix protein with protein kinase domain
MRRFLDGYEVKDANLKGFGPGLFATLLSNGIETADDLTSQRLEGIRGFGPKRISALLEWRDQIEARFKFNPSAPADILERARVERELRLEYAKEASELHQLADRIKAKAGPFCQRVATLTGELGHSQQELSALRATAAALGKAA